jgi:hypothetical protein
MKISKIIVVAGLFLLASGSIYTFAKNKSFSEERLNSSNTANNNTRLAVASFEIELTAEQLIDKSDFVVIGEITEKLKDFDYKGYYKSEYDSEDSQLLCSLYNVEIKEVLKGEDMKNVRITFGGNSLPDLIEYNTKYIICLKKAPYMEEDVYCASINQGIFSIMDDGIKNKVGMSYKINDFKKEIEMVKEKNNNGIIIPQAGLLNNQNKADSNVNQ